MLMMAGLSLVAPAQANTVTQADQAWKRDVPKLQQGFTRECLASLRRTVTSGQHPALEQRLAGYEKDFDALRQALDKDASTVRDRLSSFPGLVRDIRFLKLDVPLLFVKRHAYFSGHIYDDYLTWHPGGGIYIIENPAAPMDQQIVRPIIDPKTQATLGVGVYRDPDLSFDTRELLFAFKGVKEGDTSIFRIGLDGSGLRQILSPPTNGVCRMKTVGLLGSGVHDY